MKFFFRKARVFFWFLKAFIDKHRNFLFLGFIVGLLISLVLIKFYPLLLFRSNFGKIKKIAVVGNYTPTNLPLSLQNYLSFGLTSLDQAGNAQPALAERWEVIDEGKIYIFYLKSGIYWHDKIKFKADDVNYNLKDVKFGAISEDVLKITLKEPFSPLPTVLARPLFKKGLIGVGPYKIKSLKLKGDKLEDLLLEAAAGNLVPPIEFHFYPTETLALNAFKLGEVNVLENISEAGDFSKYPNVTVTPKVFSNFNITLFFNTKLPLLQTRAVRQALAYGLPDFTGEEKSYGPINPESWAYNPKVKVYTHNPETGAGLLEKEGVATTSAKLTISTFPSFLSLAAKIASAWEALGIKTQVKIENSLPNSFDVLLVSQEIPPDPDQYHLWHSTQPTNLSGFSNPRIDKLLEDGRKTGDLDKRIKIYQDFQRYLVEEAPAIFLYHPKLYTIERKSH